MAYNLFPEKFIFDPNDADITQTEKKGLYLTVLKDLFNKRLNLKDLKQKALKVYMNTFYEEAENSLSPIFLRELACRTTIAEKYNLNLIAEFISKKGFDIKYRNTDSLYLTCPDRYYKKCDESFSRKELSKEA
ncbi:1937_t:CDS:2, partial [Funneliformis geosporum]